MSDDGHQGLGVSQATGLGGAEAPETPSRLGPSDAIPSAARFINKIADRFQEAHEPSLGRDRALAMAVATLEWVEEDTPFGDPRCAWDDEAARAVADEDIDHWESLDG